jgi:mono/diheme cytochrome c family protein
MKTAAWLLGAIVSVWTQYAGWSIPPGGPNEKSPLSAEPRTIARGKALYAANCARCHGPEGKGSGPDSAYAADLTDELRVELNTEGVLFYKIWNGRLSYGKGPRQDMPPFEGKLGKDQVWTLVEYLKTLRTARPPVADASEQTKSACFT